MKVNLDKMICSFSCCEELNPLQYFKQFNVYETISINKSELYDSNNSYKSTNMSNLYLNISNIESTVPNIKILSTKVIDTKEGTSLEGQHLSGKKLIIIGNMSLNLILTYCFCCNKYNYPLKQTIVKVNMSFSTFIVIPKKICDYEQINIRYLIEDVSTEKLSNNKVFVSVTMLLQYLDEY